MVTEYRIFTGITIRPSFITINNNANCISRNKFITGQLLRLNFTKPSESISENNETRHKTIKSLKLPNSVFLCCRLIHIGGKTERSETYDNDKANEKPIFDQELDSL